MRVAAVAASGASSSAEAAIDDLIREELDSEAADGAS